MGTIMDYSDWRGDLSFAKDPFNDIDALILALLSYLPFKDIVPGVDSNKGISLKDTSIQYFAKNQTKEAQSPSINPTASPSLDSELLELLQKTADSARFKDIQLSKYDANTDFIVGQQFGAMTFTLPNAKHNKVIAFRGTDNSLIGWKEDFEIAYMEEIPAQKSACDYLDCTLGLFPNNVTVCGHSKGGNLAVYACSRVNTTRQNRLSKIINFDGPGFDFDIVPRASFSHCENKVINYVPEESIIGMLLEPIGERTVVASTARGINQHNALNWRAQQSKFLLGNLSSTTKLLENTLKTWLADLPIPKRKMFTEALFDIFGASEGRTIDPKETIKETKTILTKYSKLDLETKILLAKVFTSLNTKSTITISKAIRENWHNILQSS